MSGEVRPAIEMHAFGFGLRSSASAGRAVNRQRSNLGLLILPVLLVVLLLPMAWARAGEAIAYQIVIDSKKGTSVSEGVAELLSDQFVIREFPFGSLLYLSGRLSGNTMTVSGDWRGNYLVAEGPIIDGRFRSSFRTTGIIYSAFISISFPLSVTERLDRPPASAP